MVLWVFDWVKVKRLRLRVFHEFGDFRVLGDRSVRV